MVVNKVLDEVFTRWSNIAVLRALKKYGVGISGREVARVAGITVKNCFNALTDLEDLGIVERVRGGREHLFSLNWEHVLVKEAVLPLFKVEEEYFDKIAVYIKTKLKKHSVSLIVFGSVARKEETVKSDYDLCIVVKDMKQKAGAEEIVFDMKQDVNKKFGVSVSPIYFTKKEFALRAKKNKPPVNNIIKEGKVIYGRSIRELMND
jgi:predicted nucleotidyltransferase